LLNSAVKSDTNLKSEIDCIVQLARSGDFCTTNLLITKGKQKITRTTDVDIATGGPLLFFVDWAENENIGKQVN
jgi:hypothetical protein